MVSCRLEIPETVFVSIQKFFFNISSFRFSQVHILHFDMIQFFPSEIAVQCILTVVFSVCGAHHSHAGFKLSLHTRGLSGTKLYSNIV